jgi:hypothetical protein
MRSALLGTQSGPPPAVIWGHFDEKFIELDQLLKRVLQCVSGADPGTAP